MADEPKTEQTPNREVIDNLTAKDPAAKPATLDLKAPVKQVIDGKEVVKPLEEWLALANKGVGAEAKFQEAAVAREVDQAVLTLHNPQASEDQKIAAQKVILKRGGLADDAINQAIFGENPPTKDTTVTDPNVSKMGARLDAREHQLNELYEQQLEGAVEQVLSNDPDLSVYYKAGGEAPIPEGRRAEFAKVLKDEALEAMRVRAATGEKFSPKWIAGAVQGSKAKALKYAQQVIGAPQPLGRSPETMFGSDVAALVKEPKLPPRGTKGQQPFLDYIKGDMLKTVLDAGFTPTRR